MAPRLDKKSKVNTVRHRISRFSITVALCLVSLAAAPGHAGEIKLPPEAIQAMDKMYSGDPDGAIILLRNLEQAQPEILSPSCSKAKRAGGRFTAPAWKSNTG